MDKNLNCDRVFLFLQASPAFRHDQIERAKMLQNSLITQSLTKYNLSGRTLALPKGKRILVPGQVEDDASILEGTQDIKTNLDLLRTVRINNPSDIIIYKPHPDFEARLRTGYLPSK